MNNMGKFSLLNLHFGISIHTFVIFRKSTSRGDKFFSGAVRVVVNGVQSVGLIFVSLFVLSLFSETSQRGSDGTFQSTPNYIAQLYTIYALFRGKVNTNLQLNLTNFYTVYQFSELPLRLRSYDSSKPDAVPGVS